MSGQAFSSFRHAGVPRFALGRFLSAMATSATSMTMGYQLYETTHSTFALALEGLSIVLPVVLLALPAGVVADRFPRRDVAIGAHLLLALSTAAFWALAALHGPTWAYYAFLFVSGVGFAFRGPSVGAMVPQLVPPEDFVNANTWFSSLYELASALGPAVGGLLVGAFGGRAEVAFAFALFCHLGFIAILVSLPRVPGVHRRSLSLRDLLAGFRFVRRTRVFLAAITLDMFAVLLGGSVALLPVFAEDILHVGAVGLGWLRAAPAAGALCMALAHARLPSWKRPGVTLLITVVGFGLATIGFGLSESMGLSLVCLFFIGVFDNVSVVIRATLEQALTPDVMRGRVGAINHVFISLSNELGTFESGAAATLLGPVVAVVAGGVGTIAVVAGVALGFPQLRALPPLHDLQPLPANDEGE